MDSFFLEAFGLPLHPLVVHAAVVLIPLGSLVVLAGALLYRRFPLVLPVGVATSWVASVAGMLSVQSGEALGDEIGTPQPHGEWGEMLGQVFIVFAVAATLLWWFRRRTWRIASLIGTLAVVVLAPVSVVLTVLVGHGGALATWGGVLAGGEESATEQVVSSPTVNAYTLDDVAAHNTLDDCWIVVDGVVYDVSGFGPSHPGGASNIERICGTDATDAFRGQHGTSGSPNSTLAGFEIGLIN